MRQEQVCTIPPFSRWLIEAAGLLVPGPFRSDWRREWLWEIWHGYSTLTREGATHARASRRMIGFALGAFVDAGDLRMEALRNSQDNRSIARNPFVFIAALAIAFLALAGWTGGFRHCRTALGSLYPDSGQLVLLSRPLGVLGLQTPANTGQVSTWVESSTWFGNVAGFVLHDGTLEVTPNFFSVLHMDRSAHFRFLGHSVAAVKFIDPLRSPVAFSGAIARLKHPADRKAAEKHWGGFSIYDGPRVNATFLDERNRWPLYFAGGVSLLFLAAGMLHARRPPRYLAFFTVKTALVLGIVAAAWAEVATAIPIPITGGVDLGTAAPLVGFLLLSQVFVLRWSLQDQAERCPVCCRLVSMPVSVGSRSSLILDRPAVEFLCTRGHGTLRLSDLTACTGEPSQWTPVDRSWREVFAHERTA
jgi:hypothetical protein